MRLKHLCLGLAVALIGLTTLVVAQQPGQRGGPPGGRGFGGFGFFGGPGGGFSRLGLLSIPEVRRELELADEQVEAIEKLREELRARFPGPGGPGGRGPGGPPDGQRGRRGRGNNEALRLTPAEWFFVQAQQPGQPGGRGRGGFGPITEEQRAEFERQRRERAKEEREKLAEILLPHQLKRLTEIYLQLAGVAALQDDDIAAELGITEAQKAKIAEVQAANREEMGERMRELFQGGNREEIQAKMQELRRAADAKVLAVLTPEQQKKFEEMKGKPFSLPEGFGRGGFGPPGGPGGRGRGPRGGNNN